MNTRKFVIQDELEKRNYIELHTDQRKRSVTMVVMCNGVYNEMMIDMGVLKRALDEMNG